MSLGVKLYINHNPPTHSICDLREAVGWARNEDDYPAALGHYDTTVSAYTDDGRTLVGWCAIVTDNVRHAFFADVIVHPQWQRQGIGCSLVRAAIDNLRSQGITLIHADFSPEHIPFFESCGFRIGAGGFLEP